MAYEFDGNNQYISANSAIISNLPATFVAWSNLNTTTAANVILYVGKSSTTQRIVLSARGGVSNNPARILYDANGTEYADSLAGYTAEQWGHFGGILPSGSSRSAFFNGGSKGTNSNTVTGLFESNASLIGAQFVSGSLITLLNGRIAEAAIWNVALTDAEIASLAKGFKPTRIRPQSLVFYAPLLRNLQDLKGGLALTNNNGATAADHPRVY